MAVIRGGAAWTPRTPSAAVRDLVVVGAGPLGLAHAAEALRRGYTVTVVDRRPAPAPLRGTGRLTLSGVPGPLRALAARSRASWMTAARRHGLAVEPLPTLALARDDRILDTLERLSSDGARVEMLGRRMLAEHAGPATHRLSGGALLLDDLRLPPGESVPTALARGLAMHPRGRILFGTEVLGADSRTDRSPALLHTSRGPLPARRIIICADHAAATLSPGLFRPERAHPRTLLVLDGSLHGINAVVDAATLPGMVPGRTDEAGVELLAHGDGRLLLSALRTVGSGRSADENVLRAAAEVLAGTPLGLTRQSLPEPGPRGDELSVTIAEALPGIAAVRVGGGYGTALAFGLARRSLDTGFTPFHAALDAAVAS